MHWRIPLDSAYLGVALRGPEMRDSEITESLPANPLNLIRLIPA
jgi:hypothetical protein